MLTEKACYARTTILEMCVSANAGHLASSLSCVDILVALYYGGILRIRPHEPNWKDRDRFIISKGHGGIGLYPILADLGFFDKTELQTFGKDGSRLDIHPDTTAPGIEMFTGSLGHGLGVGAGLALAAKMDGKSYKTVVLLGDGECYEGSIWEAAMFASGHQLSNLMAIIDRNKLCVLDFTENVLPLEPLDEKWGAFGWDVVNIDGHSFMDLLIGFHRFGYRQSSKPLMIIAHTTKGKGVSCMENTPKAHTQVPSGNDLEKARRELVWKK